ncbi:hypothetical protein AMECASPLE_005305 [Ameca splendens]|uniref:Uncharacterized protein n=1 Tax=Ameca splendens TaxID=208324 RepID=A0ABV0XN58_9TELE
MHCQALNIISGDSVSYPACVPVTAQLTWWSCTQPLTHLIRCSLRGRRAKHVHCTEFFTSLLQESFCRQPRGWHSPTLHMCVSLLGIHLLQLLVPFSPPLSVSLSVLFTLVKFK